MQIQLMHDINMSRIIIYLLHKTTSKIYIIQEAYNYNKNLFIHT